MVRLLVSLTPRTRRRSKSIMPRSRPPSPEDERAQWTIGKVWELLTANLPELLHGGSLREERQAMAILSSPEGQAAVADVLNYATGGVSFVYTEIEEIVC